MVVVSRYFIGTNGGFFRVSFKNALFFLSSLIKTIHSPFHHNSPFVYSPLILFSFFLCLCVTRPSLPLMSSSPSTTSHVLHLFPLSDLPLLSSVSISLSFWPPQFFFPIS